jgi:hypothetical protein
MAKVAFDIAVGFATQADEVTYADGVGASSADLDGISGTWGGDPDTTDEGLLLGDPESGIGESGLSFSVGRRSRDKAVLAGSFTRPISDWLAAEVRTFSFSFPFVGSKRTTTVTTPVDADFPLGVGADAIMEAFGFQGAAWGAGVGHSYKFDTANALPISALIYYYGNRLELLNCRGKTLSIEYTPGGIAVATAEFAVGSIKDPALTDVPLSAVALPALTYGQQADVNTPPVESVAHAWQNTRGFQSLTLTVNNTVDDIPDSNAVDGIVKETSAREVTIEAELFVDGTGEGEVYELEQAFADAVGDLDALSFTVGTPETTGLLPAVAHTVSIPTPELDETEPGKFGSKAGNTVSLIARAATANDELEIIFK